MRALVDWLRLLVLAALCWLLWLTAFGIGWLIQLVVGRR